MPKTLTKVRIAEYLGVSRPTLDKYVKSKDFPKPIKLPSGHKPRWNIEDIDAWRMQQNAE